MKLIKFILVIVGIGLQAIAYAQNKNVVVGTSEVPGTQQIKVFYEKGKFAGWPANWGMWNWGNEILVGYTMADHKDTKGHNYERSTSVAKFSRSTDGGLTWKMEDAFEHGITEATWEHILDERSKAATRLEGPIDFMHKDFALTFRMKGELYEGTSFYYTYNRGKSWNGPFELTVDFKGPKPTGIVSRTDYIIEGKHQMTAFITVGFKDAERTWRQVASIRSTDGGKTWTHLSWIGPEGLNSIMPSSLRFSKTKLLTIIRRTSPPEMVSFSSVDNGINWSQLKNPVKVDANGHPPALLKLKDGRLCMVYGIRHEATMPQGIGMYVVLSKDEGQTWGEPKLLRGNDGGSWDIGYPRALQLPNGKVVATYYYNNSGQGDKYRYIAASIFDPSKIK